MACPIGGESASHSGPRVIAPSDATRGTQSYSCVGSMSRLRKTEQEGEQDELANHQNVLLSVSSTPRAFTVPAIAENPMRICIQLPAVQPVVVIPVTVAVQRALAGLASVIVPKALAVLKTVSSVTLAPPAVQAVAIVGVTVPLVAES